MKKTIIPILIIASLIFPASAKQISESQACIKAKQFVRSNSRLKNLSTDNVQLAYTQTTSDNSNILYVFNNADWGFVMVAGDDCVEPILGYSDTGTFDPLNIPPGLLTMMNEYTKEISHAIDNNLTPAATSTPDTRTGIAPLLKTKWGQSTPFNNMCPDNGKGGHCVTGCTATAMAQVMKHHNWPLTGTGGHSYKTPINGVSTDVSADFSTATYDWSNMLNVYGSGATEAQCNAVAQLLFHCGVSTELGYGTTSGAATLMVHKALANYFGYDKSIKFTLREFYSIEGWNDLIYNELKNNRPVHMAGYNQSSGHAFVCDGYDKDGFFHINWGWCGLDDGYFKLSALNPTEQGIGGSEDGYSSGIEIVYNIKPDEGGSATIEGAVYGNFLPDVYTVEAGATQAIKFDLTGYFTVNIYSAYNLIKLGLMAVNNETAAETYINSDIYTNIKTSYYYSLNNGMKVESRDIVQALADGSYTVYPAVYDFSYNRICRAFVPYGRVPYLNLVVEGGALTFSVPEEIVPTRLSIDNLTFNTRFYKGNNYSVTASIKNSGRDYCARIYPAIFDANGNLLGKGKPEVYEIATGQTTTHTLVNSMPSSITAGEYFFGMLDNSGNLIGEKQPITVKDDNGLYSLQVGIFSIKNSYAVDAANVQMTARVTCSGGYFNGALDAYIFRYGGTSICYAKSDVFDLIPGETKVINFNVPFPKGEVGITYQAGIFNYNHNRCEKLTALKDFTVAQNTGIDDVDANHAVDIYPNPAVDVVTVKSNGNIGAVSIYNMAGKQVASHQAQASDIATIGVSHLAPGIYVVRIATSRGLITKRLIKK